MMAIMMASWEKSSNWLWHGACHKSKREWIGGSWSTVLLQNGKSWVEVVEEIDMMMHPDGDGDDLVIPC